MTEVPEEVRRLADERQAAREAGAFAAADELRDRIAALGYRVVDRPEGPSLEPAAPAVSPRVRAGDVQSLLGETPNADATIQWLVEGWADDVVRGIAGFRSVARDRDVQHVVADVTETDPAAYGEDVEVLGLEPETGWGAARNAGLRRSRGRIVVVVDGSIEPTGDVLGPIERVLADPTVGVCGPFGISTRDLREFHESPGPDVDAVEGYLMAFRRDVIRDVGLFDERFRWYRTADIECSFRIKDAGLRAVTVELAVARHEHRMWASTPAAERDRLSKRNFYRFLERFRGRFDLLVEPPPLERDPDPG
ncbi:MAG TPA: glycosyltransferase [Actinomycetota bacterium]|jgi:cysteinyl-tRNA synthetase